MHHDTQVGLESSNHLGPSALSLLSLTSLWLNGILAASQAALVISHPKPADWRISVVKLATVLSLAMVLNGYLPFLPEPGYILYLMSVSVCIYCSYLVKRHFFGTVICGMWVAEEPFVFLIMQL